MFFKLPALYLYIHIVFVCLFNNFILSKIPTKMCLHKNIKGYDDLERPIDINWQFDKYDDCDYINLENIVNVTDKDLSVVQLNIRGLSSKIGDLNHLINHLQSSGQPDILLLCETWLSSNSPPITVPGYSIVKRNRQTKKGGGIAILISNHLSSRPREDLTLGNECESVFAEVKLGRSQALICSAYRPLNTDCKKFISSFNTRVKELQKIKNMTLVIGLDHNMDFLKSTNHVNTQNFLEGILETDLTPTITRPTCITHSSATLIDNILVSSELIGSTKSFIGIDNMSDHLPCITVLQNALMTSKEPVTIHTRKLDKLSLNRLNTELNNRDWTNELTSNDCNQNFEIFHNILLNEINHFVPMTTKTIKYKKLRREPWLTAGLVKSINKDKRLYRQSIKVHATALDITKYRNYHQVLGKIKRQTKRQHYIDQCEKFKNNTKKLWQTINKVIGQTSDKTTIIDRLKIDNQTCYDPKKITNKLGKYFASVGKTYAEKIAQPKNSIKYYLSKITKNRKSLFLCPTTTTEFNKYISNLPNKTSSGHDEINNVLLKQIKGSILLPLNKIFNDSLVSGTFPTRMKLAEVIPLHKGKAKDIESNYRPISLLLTISKILEKVMYNRL